MPTKPILTCANPSRRFFAIPCPPLSELQRKPQNLELKKNVFGLPDYDQFRTVIESTEESLYHDHSLNPPSKSKTVLIHGVPFKVFDANNISESDVSSESSQSSSGSSSKASLQQAEQEYHPQAVQQAAHERSLLLEREQSSSVEYEHPSSNEQDRSPEMEQKSPTLAEQEHPPLAKQEHSLRAEHERPRQTEQESPFKTEQERLRPKNQEYSHPIEREYPSRTEQEHSFQTELEQEHPSQTEQEHPSQTEQEHPLQGELEHSSQAEPEHPSQIEQECPSQAEQEHPSQIEQEFPSQAELEHPSQIEQEYPSQAEQEYPSQTKLEHASQDILDYPSQTQQEHASQTILDHTSQTEQDRASQTVLDRPSQTQQDRPSQTQQEHPFQTGLEQPPQTGLEQPPQTELEQEHSSHIELEHSPQAEQERHLQSGQEYPHPTEHDIPQVEQDCHTLEEHVHSLAERNHHLQSVPRLLPSLANDQSSAPSIPSLSQRSSLLNSADAAIQPLNSASTTSDRSEDSSRPDPQVEVDDACPLEAPAETVRGQVSTKQFSKSPQRPVISPRFPSHSSAPLSEPKLPTNQIQNLAVMYGDESSSSPYSPHVSRRVSVRMSQSGLSHPGRLFPRYTRALQRITESPRRLPFNTTRPERSMGISNPSIPVTHRRRSSSITYRSRLSGPSGFIVIGRGDGGAYVCEASDGRTFQLVIDIQPSESFHSASVQCSPEQILLEMERAFAAQTSYSIGCQTDMDIVSTVHKIPMVTRSSDEVDVNCNVTATEGLPLNRRMSSPTPASTRDSHQDSPKNVTVGAPVADAGDLSLERTEPEAFVPEYPDHAHEKSILPSHVDMEKTNVDLDQTDADLIEADPVLGPNMSLSAERVDKVASDRRLSVPMRDEEMKQIEPMIVENEDNIEENIATKQAEHTEMQNPASSRSHGAAGDGDIFSSNPLRNDLQLQDSPGKDINEDNSTPTKFGADIQNCITNELCITSDVCKDDPCSLTQSPKKQKQASSDDVEDVAVLKAAARTSVVRPIMKCSDTSTAPNRLEETSLKSGANVNTLMIEKKDGPNGRHEQNRRAHETKSEGDNFVEKAVLNESLSSNGSIKKSSHVKSRPTDSPVLVIVRTPSAAISIKPSKRFLPSTPAVEAREESIQDGVGGTAELPAENSEADAVPQFNVLDDTKPLPEAKDMVLPTEGNDGVIENRPNAGEDDVRTEITVEVPSSSHIRRYATSSTAPPSRSGVITPAEARENMTRLEAQISHSENMSALPDNNVSPFPSESRSTTATACQAKGSRDHPGLSRTAGATPISEGVCPNVLDSPAVNREAFAHDLPNCRVSSSTTPAAKRRLISSPRSFMITFKESSATKRGLQTVAQSIIETLNNALRISYESFYQSIERKQTTPVMTGSNEKTDEAIGKDQVFSDKDGGAAEHSSRTCPRKGSTDVLTQRKARSDSEPTAEVTRSGPKEDASEHVNETGCAAKEFLGPEQSEDVKSVGHDETNNSPERKDPNPCGISQDKHDSCVEIKNRDTNSVPLEGADSDKTNYSPINDEGNAVLDEEMSPFEQVEKTTMVESHPHERVSEVGQREAPTLQLVKEAGTNPFDVSFVLSREESCDMPTTHVELKHPCRSSRINRMSLAQLEANQWNRNLTDPESSNIIEQQTPCMMEMYNQENLFTGEVAERTPYAVSRLRAKVSIAPARSDIHSVGGSLASNVNKKSYNSHGRRPRITVVKGQEMKARHFNTRSSVLPSQTEERLQNQSPKYPATERTNVNAASSKDKVAMGANDNARLEQTLKQSDNSAVIRNKMLRPQNVETKKIETVQHSKQVRPVMFTSSQLRNSPSGKSDSGHMSETILHQRKQSFQLSKQDMPQVRRTSATSNCAIDLGYQSTNGDIKRRKISTYSKRVSSKMKTSGKSDPPLLQNSLKSEEQGVERDAEDLNLSVRNGLEPEAIANNGDSDENVVNSPALSEPLTCNEADARATEINSAYALNDSPEIGRNASPLEPSVGSDVFNLKAFSESGIDHNGHRTVATGTLAEINWVHDTGIEEGFISEAHNTIAQDLEEATQGESVDDERKEKRIESEIEFVRPNINVEINPSFQVNDDDGDQLRPTRIENNVESGEESYKETPELRVKKKRKQKMVASRKSKKLRQNHELAALEVMKVQTNSRANVLESDGRRRSRRQRFPRLKYWKNETVRYERRLSQSIPTIAQVVVDIGESDSEDCWVPGRR